MFWRQWKTELIKRYQLNREGIKLVVELFIRFPLDNQQLHRIKANFMAADEDVFVNRKKVHSINTQIAFDATFNILYVAKWPGSTRDPRILMGSGLRREAPWLSLQDVLTPYLSPQPGAQLKYNMQARRAASSKLVKAEIIPLISSNSLSGFLWTINNYTASKPTSWHANMQVWSVLLTGRS
ncbi:hypothetical protein N1851_031785 [Merluccius polli]|uniref:DDE Tnp4 domain-containing protein n=1 Tax=Merluccius polli TaxID=89951 RepID=A0AA47M3I1_MERPO|nr:hypothetical protein N1851_031785 [Merluccius polli]